MIKDIKFSGYSAQPSDYESKDGDLAVSINLVPEDGALKPVQSPAVKFKLDNGQSVVYIHKGNNYVNYIISQVLNDKICISIYGGCDILSFQISETLTDICSIGNILIISTSLNLYYLYFKDSQYIFLGNELPKVEMSFALSAEFVSKEHKTSLTFSDYQSADSTWKPYVTGSFDTDMIRTSSAGYITSTIAKDVKIHLSNNIEAGTEYKLRVVANGCTDVYLYAATSDSSQYEQIAHIYNCGETKIKPSKTYTTFKANVFNANGGVPSWHASGEIKVFSGFDNVVGGRVIEYNETNFNAVSAAINKFVAGEATNRSLFVYPFFVRYALRLFDGSYARISEPILLIPNSGYAPMVSFKQNANNLTLYSFVASLQYAFLNSIGEKWKDIISGVDVFVSQQVYPYNQGDNFDENKNLFQYAISNSDYGIDQITDTDFGYCELHDVSSQSQYGYSKHDLATIAKEIHGFNDTSKQTDWRVIRLAPVDDQIEKLQQISNFYLIHSFDLDDIEYTIDDFGEAVYKDFKLKDGTLSSLVARKTLTDDSFSNCRFFDSRLTVYNQRLHLFDFHFAHHIPSTPAALLGHIYRYDSYGTLVKVKVFIHTTNGERVVVYNVNESSEYSAYIQWFFYPHNKAYKAILTYKKSDKEYFFATLKLTSHDFLYGAYWIADSLDDSIVLSSQSDNDEDNAPINDTSYYPNSVLQSAVSNPFSFSASGLVTFGVQRIQAMASAAKALSQGQFGQFPLYAFTTEGVWALEVSNTGSYTARQPITRDVCINSEGITQIDSSVLFPTDRGIMLISGSQTQCITDTIKTEFPFDLLSLPHMKELHDRLNHNSEYDKCLPMLPFTEFLKTCRMIYDYVHQRIIVYNSAVTYAYVYSLKSQLWGMTYSNIADNVNSYPNALAIDTTGNLVDFSLAGDDDVHSMLVTRPLKLETPDILKTMDTVIQRGHFQKGHVQSVLYGSRDLYNWHLVWSSKDHYMRGFRGSPYKYFRIALLCNLSPDESVFGASLQFTPRLTDQPR